VIRRWISVFLARGRHVEMLGPKVKSILGTALYIILFCIIMASTFISSVSRNFSYWGTPGNADVSNELEWANFYNTPDSWSDFVWLYFPRAPTRIISKLMTRSGMLVRKSSHLSRRMLMNARLDTWCIVEAPLYKVHLLSQAHKPMLLQIGKTSSRQQGLFIIRS